jgi:AcrR family transcriptional regulator
MPRPSQHTDQRLIKAARGLIEETGCSGLNLRRVAERARVNLGMFHYHFGTKEEFCRQVLNNVYETFFKEFTLEAAGHEGPRENLRAALIVLAQFASDNRRLLFALLRDAMNGEAVVQTFLQANVPRHLGLIAALVSECQARGGPGRIPPVNSVATLVGAVVMPAILVEGLRRQAGRGQRQWLGALDHGVLTHEAIVQRVDAALTGLVPVGTVTTARRKA